MSDVSAERIVKVEEREKSNTHRIDRLENLAEAIHRQNENIARLVERLEATASALDAQEKRLSEMEKLPRWRENTVFSSAATAVASAAAGALIAIIFS
jgi:septal ring factor EnvC (AmiA/AmiB activator)